MKKFSALLVAALMIGSVGVVHAADDAGAKGKMKTKDCSKMKEGKAKEKCMKAQEAAGGGAGGAGAGAPPAAAPETAPAPGGAGGAPPPAGK